MTSTSPKLVTTLGDLTRDQLGWILPHEHVFVDLRTWDQPGYGEADTADVIALMQPELEAAKADGVTAIVDAAALGVGRRADILRAVSEAANLPLVVPTGMYREPWALPFAHTAPVEEIADLFLRELTVGIEDSGVVTGWIKIGSSPDILTPTEEKVLRAAVTAAEATGAIIGSHTTSSAVARRQVDVIQEAGGDPTRFIWVHTQSESNVQIHHELAARGIWLEYDCIGDPKDDDQYLRFILAAFEARYERQVLISHDRGWYDPAQPGGGTPKPYTYIPQVFLGKLREAGVDEAGIDMLMRQNPFAAYACPR